MKAEQGFCAALQGAFVGRPANLDMGNLPGVIAMGEPGAPIRPLAQNIGGARRRQDAKGKLAVLGEISPGVGPWRAFWLCGPAIGGRAVGEVLFPPAESLGESWGAPDEFAQDLADLAEIKARFEMLDKVEHVALGIALRVPPASALVVENEDFAASAPVFEAMFGALLAIDLPGRRLVFEERGAMDSFAQVLDLGVITWHVSCSRSRTGPSDGRRFPFVISVPDAVPQPRGGPAARAR